jgi:hypothetical protein
MAAAESGGFSGKEVIRHADDAFNPSDTFNVSSAQREVSGVHAL